MAKKQTVRTFSDKDTAAAIRLYKQGAMKKTLRNLTNLCAGCGPISECPILESLGNGAT